MTDRILNSPRTNRERDTFRRSSFGKLVVIITLAVYLSPTAAFAQSWMHRHTLNAGGPGSLPGRFGYDTMVSLDGNHAIIGHMGANEHCLNEPACGSGAAYLFDVIQGRQIQRFTDTPQVAGGLFGRMAAISDKTIAIASGDIPIDFGDFTIGSADRLDILDRGSGSIVTSIVASDVGATHFEWVRTVVDNGQISFVASGENGRHGYILDIATREERLKLPNVQEQEIRDGLVLFSNDIDDSVHLASISTGEIHHTLAHPDGFRDKRLSDVALSEDHALVYSIDDELEEYKVSVFDTTNGQFRRDLDFSNHYFVDDLQVDGDFAILSFRNVRRDGERPRPTFQWAEIFNVKTGESVFEFPKVESYFHGASISGNTAIFASRQPEQEENQLLVAQFTDSIAGDFDNDSMLTADDIDLLSSVVRNGGSDFFDINSDTQVDEEDRSMWVDSIANTYFGDSNLDGELNTNDFVEVFVAGEYEDAIEMNSSWATGDWNGDGEFNSRDLVTAFQNGGFEIGPRAESKAIPEPSGALLMVIAFFGLASRRSFNQSYE